jgi:hypothetical protein
MVEIVRFMRRADGSCNLGVDVGDSVRVLVEPTNIDAQAHAEEIASLLARQTDKITDLEREVATLREFLQRVRAARDAAEKSLSHVLAGKRRFFGRALVKPATPSAWDGEVWLLDPEKQERGWSMRFASMAEVRQEYPELWPVGTTEDGILLDACSVSARE